MQKGELKELVKQVIQEEQDYQALFKLMLKRSGKDINSMSDEEKKKFFTAVDKAYKAKTEGKLRYSNKFLNENVLEFIMTPLASFLLLKFVLAFVYEIYWKVAKNIYKEQDQFAIKFVLDKIKDDSAFIKSTTEIIKNSGKLTRSAANKIVNLPIVKSNIKNSALATQKKYKEKNAMNDVVLENLLIDYLVDTWNDTSIQNSIISDIKKKLNAIK